MFYTTFNSETLFQNLHHITAALMINITHFIQPLI